MSVFASFFFSLNKHSVILGIYFKSEEIFRLVGKTVEDSTTRPVVQSQTFRDQQERRIQPLG